jgi:CRISPR-associated endonuclease/helicase Cas3
VETYEQHIAYVLAAFEQTALPELRYPAEVLERAAGWAEGSVLSAAWLVCLLHDVGKLSSGWQMWAHYYQNLIGKPVDIQTALAHTDREWNNQAHWAAEKQARKKYPKPRHAAEGALAVSRILATALGRDEPLTRAALTAIVRHHAPFVSDCTTFNLTQDAKRHIAATLEVVPNAIQAIVQLDLLRMQQQATPAGFDTNVLIAPAQEFGWVAYTLLVRALRRADQMGTAQGARG